MFHITATLRRAYKPCLSGRGTEWLTVRLAQHASDQHEDLTPEMLALY